MKIISHSLNDTMNIGKAIARNLGPGDIICLFGTLGSGKTVLTKGIARGLGIASSCIVSPSFVLIREYSGMRFPLYHFDLFRLKNPKDILALGYEEYLFSEGSAVIEWADRLEYLLPREYLRIELFIRGDKQRLLKFGASGARYRGLLKKIYENIRH